VPPAVPLPIHTLSLHDALPIWTPCARCGPPGRPWATRSGPHHPASARALLVLAEQPSGTSQRRKGREASLSQPWPCFAIEVARRSEEHTSELQSRGHLVCRLLL